MDNKINFTTDVEELNKMKEELENCNYQFQGEAPEDNNMKNMIKNIRAAECDIDGSKMAIDITDGKILERNVENGIIRADMKITLTLENCQFFVTDMLEDDPLDIGSLNDLVHSIIHNISIFTYENIDIENIDIIEKDEYDKE